MLLSVHQPAAGEVKSRCRSVKFRSIALREILCACAHGGEIEQLKLLSEVGGRDGRKAGRGGRR